MLRSLALICCVLAGSLAAADEITMKNGQKVEGKVRGLQDGQLEIAVSSGYLGGFPSFTAQKLRFSNVRGIKFDGQDDYFSIVRKNDDLAFGYIRELSRGKFTVDGQDPIPSASVKALVPSTPDEQDKK